MAADAPLVRQGAEHAAVGATVERNGRSTSLQVQITPGRSNRAWVNRAPLTRPRDLLGVLRAVVFAPEDLALVKGDPSHRRRFLDDLLVLRAPRLAGTRADYEKVIKQRTALLRTFHSARGRASHGGAATTLDVWDDQLVAAGSELLHARSLLVSELQDAVSRAYQAVAPSTGETVLSYLATAAPDTMADSTRTDTPPGGSEAPMSGLPATTQEWADALRSILSRRRQDELDRGVCLVGPHRDELLLTLRGMPARGYASQGESWSYALSLRLASFLLLQEIDDAGSPVLILDDVLAELDAERRRSLAAAVAEADQVLVTAAVADDVPEQLAGPRIRVPEDVGADPARAERSGDDPGEEGG